MFNQLFTVSSASITIFYPFSLSAKSHLPKHAMSMYGVIDDLGTSPALSFVLDTGHVFEENGHLCFGYGVLRAA